MNINASCLCGERKKERVTAKEEIICVIGCMDNHRITLQIGSFLRVVCGIDPKENKKEKANERRSTWESPKATHTV